MLGQAEDLRGGVFKKRLRKNQYRCIILARAGHYWVYEYLFAKQDRANIEDDELADFRKLVKAYAGLTTHQVNQLMRTTGWRFAMATKRKFKTEAFEAIHSSASAM